MLRELAKKFADKEVRPLAAAIDQQADVPRSLIEKAAELGFLGVPFPEQYGGGDMGEIGYCIILEEIAKACLSTAVVIGGHVSIGAMAVYLAGSEAQKQRFLPELCCGDKIAAFALTEPQAGSDAAAIASFAEKRGDKYILNGQKTFITNGGIADIYSVFAKTDKTAGIKGISAFIVEKERKGFRAGKPEAKMGIKGSHTADLFFEEMEIPLENRLGEEGEGFKIAMQTLDAGRLSLGAQCLGVAKEALNLSGQTRQYPHSIRQAHRQTAGGAMDDCGNGHGYFRYGKYALPFGLDVRPGTACVPAVGASQTVLFRSFSQMRR